MTYQVTTGQGGLAGWALLKRTEQQQMALVAREGSVSRAATNFRDKIGTVANADELISDFHLMKVALHAFGLERDIPNKAFIRKVLESNLSDPKSLANRLSDKTYRKMAEAFGFGQQKDRAFTESSAERIIEKYVSSVFEERVGRSDNDLRLALNARRELLLMAARGSGSDTKWYEVLGNPPLRKVFETAFGFDDAYRGLPIDRLHGELKEAAGKMFGSDDMGQFRDPQKVETLITRFLARSAVKTSIVTNGYSVALALLTGR